MSKKFYTEYVRHALRFYTRYLHEPVFQSDASKENWKCCYSVLSKYPEKDRDILIDVYKGYDTIADEVYNASKKYNICQDVIWDMMKEAERKIALRRGLL